MSSDEKIEIAKLWREVMDVWVRGFDYTKGYPRHLTDPYGRGIKDALGQLCPSLQQQLHKQQTKETMSKFKKGDRVKVIRESSINLGREGVVMRVYEDSGSYDVDLGDTRGVSFTETSLTLLDQPLSTTPDKVLQAAKTSPQAKDALKALFPDVFKEEPLTSRMGGGSRIFDGVFIGADGSYIIAEGGVEVRAKEQAYGTTTITFHKKP